MLVFGTKGMEKDRGRGVFHCPQCRLDRPYIHKELVRKGHVFFVPVVELGSVAEFVECQHCGSQFTMEVLNLPTQASMEQRLGITVRSAIAGMIRADSLETVAEKQAGRYVLQGLIGEAISDSEQRADLDTSDPRAALSALSDLAPNLTEQGKVQILEACVVVAASDGQIGDAEIEVLTEFADALGVPTQYLPGIVASAIGDS